MFVYFQDKHMLSRLLMLLNPNYASSSSSQSSASNRNRRPTRKKKPIINVVEEETWNNFFVKSFLLSKTWKKYLFYSVSFENVREHSWMMSPKEGEWVKAFCDSHRRRRGVKIAKICKTASSIGLGFFNPSSQLRCTDVTAFCMQLGNWLVR